MTFPPTGTVTFLFTDIEGSTMLAQQYPDAYSRALERHHSILQNAITSNGGFVFGTAGDSFFAAFQNAEDAVRSSVDAQLKLADEEREDSIIKVRMGIHTGNVEWNGKNYMGYLVLARTARIMSAANGDQIVISDTALTLCDAVKNSFTFRDLGIRRLKDVIEPIRLYQIIAPGMRENFPPLKTLDSHPNNLPVQLTQFIGREAEIVQVKNLLRQNSLLTITGPGGTGKTRIALQSAADLIDEFKHGVWLAELDSISDPDVIYHSTMQTLGISEQANQDNAETLCEFLKDKELLLILDNCEHLIEACSVMVERLLRRSAKLKILTTSREALRCSGEQTFRILSMKTPDPKDENTAEQLTQYESVRLFIERALAVNQNFRVNNSNAPALAEICFQLDGIPLAIELAAARVKILPLEKILERLKDRFTLLTGGGRNILPRKQTLKALVDWSYDLLSEKEKELWHKLSIFASGWTLEAAEEICSDENMLEQEIFDTINDLAKKSIIVYNQEKDRFRMLETIRQYGMEKLTSSGESDRIEEKHLKYYLRLADIPGNKLRGKEGGYWMNLLNNEANNVEKALNRALEDPEGEDGLSLALNMGYYWQIKGYYSEGMRLIETALSKRPDASTLNHIRAHSSLGNFARLRSEYSKAEEHLKKALKISREIKVKDDEAAILHRLAILEYDRGNYNLAEKLYIENLKHYQTTGDKPAIGRTLNNLANTYSVQGNIEKANTMYEESLEIRREEGDVLGISVILCNIGILAYQSGNFEKAKNLLNESLQIRIEIGDRSGASITFANLGNSSFNQGEYAEAKKFYEESLSIYREIGDPAGIAEALSNLGNVSMENGDIEKALSFYEESLAIARKINLELLAALSLHGMGTAAFANREYDVAGKLYLESLMIFKQKSSLMEIEKVMMNIAELMVSSRKFSEAARLFSFIETEFIQNRKLKLAKSEQMILDNSLVIVKDEMNADNFLNCSEEGKNFSLEDAVLLSIQFLNYGI